MSDKTIKNLEEKIDIRIKKVEDQIVSSSAATQLNNIIKASDYYLYNLSPYMKLDKFKVVNMLDEEYYSDYSSAAFYQKGIPFMNGFPCNVPGVRKILKESKSPFILSDNDHDSLFRKIFTRTKDTSQALSNYRSFAYTINNVRSRGEVQTWDKFKESPNGKSYLEFCGGQNSDQPTKNCFKTCIDCENKLFIPKLWESWKMFKEGAD